MCVELCRCVICTSTRIRALKFFGATPRYDGQDSEAVNALKQVQHLDLIFIHKPHASLVDLERFTAYELLTKSQWSGRPGNYQLMLKQGVWHGRLA
jgi:hypothetical protein